MVSLAVVVSDVPSRWYSLFDGDFLPGDIQDLSPWYAETHYPGVTPVNWRAESIFVGERSVL